MLIGVTPLNTAEKYDMAFTVLGDSKIYIEDLIRITEIIQFKIDISKNKIEEKVKAMH